MSPDSKTLILVTRSETLAEGLCAITSTVPEIECQAKSEQYDAALALIERSKPKLVLLDTHAFSENESVRFLIRVRMISPQTKCLVLADTADQQSHIGLFAHQVLLHGTPARELVTVLEKL